MPGGRYSRPWFKIYDDARTDEKLATLTDAQHRVWFGLMCLANSDPERGSISGARASQPALLALAAARGDEALLAATLARLVALNIVEVLHDPGTGAVLAYTFVHWAERQDQTPSARPAAVRARVRRYRQRQRSPDTPDDNSLHSLPGAPDVTPVTRVTDVTRYTSLHPSGRSDANSLHSLQWSPNVTTAAGVVTDVTRYTSLHARGASGANSLHSLPPEAAARNECNDLDESTALIADVTTDERREDRDTTTVITDQNDQPNSHTRARLDKLDLDHPRASARQVKSGAAGERAAPAQMRVSAAKLAWWNAYLDEQAQDIPVPAEWRTLPWMQRVLARFLAVARSRGTRHADWAAAAEAWFISELEFHRRDVQNARAGMPPPAARVPAVAVTAPAPRAPAPVQGLDAAARAALDRELIDQALARWGQGFADASGPDAARTAMLAALVSAESRVGAAGLVAQIDAALRLYGAHSWSDVIALLPVRPAAPATEENQP